MSARVGRLTLDVELLLARLPLPPETLLLDIRLSRTHAGLVELLLAHEALPQHDNGEVIRGVGVIVRKDDDGCDRFDRWA